MGAISKKRNVCFTICDKVQIYAKEIMLMMCLVGLERNGVF